MSDQDSSKPAPHCKCSCPPNCPLRAPYDSHGRMRIDPSEWTERQRQEVAFAHAMEALPALWDVRDPLYKSRDAVNRASLALAEKHREIFKLPSTRPDEEVQTLWDEMKSNYMAVICESVERFNLKRGSNEDDLRRSSHYCQKKLPYHHAMLFTSQSDTAFLEMVENRKGPKLIYGENGEKKIRFLDGSIEDIRAMPLPMAKLRVHMEMERYKATVEELCRHLKLKNDRLEVELSIREKDNILHLYEYVMQLKDDDE